MTEPTTLAEQVTVLGERVANGIHWLLDHDQGGEFHFWFKSGLTARSPMPAQSEDRRTEWQAYYEQRVRWERLWTQLDRLEKKAAREAKA